MSQAICLKGVRLSCLVQIIGEWDQVLLKSATTSEVLEKFIHPATADKKCSYVDLLEEKRSEAVSTATVFVSHAWQYLFMDVMEALTNYFQSEMDVVIWFDVLSNNQHLAPTRDFNWWSSTFKGAISAIGRTVMVLTPWDDPIPLTRGWCIWELYCTIETNCAFGVAMMAESSATFTQNMDQNPLHFIEKMYATINCQSSECRIKEDERQIHSAIEQTIGFPGMNKKIFEELRNWVVRTYEDECHRKESVLGERHPTTLEALANLGLLYFGDDRLNEAENTFLTCLEKMRSVFNEEESWQVLLVKSSLADVYFGRGDYSEAERIYTNILSTARKVCGESDHKTLHMLCQLGQIQSYKGDYRKAEPLLLECYKKRAKLLGPLDRDTLSVMDILALMYTDESRFKEAEELHLQCFELSRRSMGESHPFTLTLRNNLGRCYFYQGEFKKAEPIFTETLKNQIFLGENHHTYLSTMDNLVATYAGLQQYDKAESLSKECFAKRIQALGEDHPETLESMNNLSRIYQGKGDTEEAMRILNSCIEKARRVLGEMHPKTIVYMSNRAVNMIQNGDYKVGEVHLKEVMEKTKATAGTNNEDYKYLTWVYHSTMDYHEILKEEGNAFFKKQQYALAIEKYLQTLESFENSIYSSIAMNNKDKGDLMNAIKNLWYVLNTNIAVCYLKQSNGAKALEYASEAVSLNFIGWKGYMRQGEAFSLLGRFPEAIGAYDLALRFVDNDANREVIKSLKEKIEKK